MDHVMSVDACEEEPHQRIVAALRGGIVLVDEAGEVVWMDDVARRRINGGLQSLGLPLPRPEIALDGFVAPVDVVINGEQVSLCVIQETGAVKEPERDLIAAIQAVMSDTSWFTRTVLDKLKALRQARQPDEAPQPSVDDADVLSDREREVLGLICEGRGDAEMSTILQLSPNTVRNHIVSLYRKIGVNRRSAAIIWARERGITSLTVVAPRRRRAPPTQSGARPMK